MTRLSKALILAAIAAVMIATLTRLSILTRTILAILALRLMIAAASVRTLTTMRDTL
jgi:hypothetical protein